MKTTVIYSKCPVEGREAITDPSYRCFEFKTEPEALVHYHKPGSILYSCVHVHGKGCVRAVLDGTCPVHRPPMYPPDSCSCRVRTAHLS